MGSLGGLLLLEWQTGIGSCFGKEVFRDVIAIALDKRAMRICLYQLGQLLCCEWVPVDAFFRVFFVTATGKDGTLWVRSSRGFL